MQSKATTVEQYLAELPADRRAELQAVRALFLKSLDKKFEEGMQYGMLGYYVPHRIFPDGYHCDPRQPLPFAGLAAQKNHLSLYIMGIYGDQAEREKFESAWAKTGKKLDMGKACIRFKRAEDLALDVIGETIRRMPAGRYIEQYKATRDGGARSGGPKRVSPSKQSPKKGLVPKSMNAKKSKPTATKKSAPKKRLAR